MKKITISTDSLRVKANTRLQCMHGCLHYKVNPLCPPACPDVQWFENISLLFKKVNVFYEIFERSDMVDAVKKRKSFHVQLLDIERKLKMNGKCYTLCCISGACTICTKEVCSAKECERRLLGRTPVCATGIDLMHLFTGILKLPLGVALSFWKPNLSSDYFSKSNKSYLCLGLIFY